MTAALLTFRGQAGGPWIAARGNVDVGMVMRQPYGAGFAYQFWLGSSFGRWRAAAARAEAEARLADALRDWMEAAALVAIEALHPCEEASLAAARTLPPSRDYDSRTRLGRGRKGVTPRYPQGARA